MSRFWPTPAEEAMLRFVFPMPDLRGRFLLAGCLFAAGTAAWCLIPVFGVIGLGLIFAGHLCLWVLPQSNAPGGATPAHEEIWVPVEEGWFERLEKLEQQGKRWDASPWDITSGAGCLMLLLVLVVLAAGVGALGILFGFEAIYRLGVAAAVLVVPLWLSGIRTVWNPSELRLKGEALAVACKAIETQDGGDFEPVPMLALREGRRGKYPVDARLMLRPASEEAPGFLGVQVQVAINNVRGTDYPYLYSVVLGKKGFVLPDSKRRHRPEGRSIRMVFERGQDAEVEYLVIRRYADNSGGWHTKPENIQEIVTIALEEARRARDANREGRGG